MTDAWLAYIEDILLVLMAISGSIIIIDITLRRRIDRLEKTFKSTRWKPDTMTLTRLTTLEEKVRNLEYRMPDRKKHPHEPQDAQSPL